MTRSFQHRTASTFLKYKDKCPAKIKSHWFGMAEYFQDFQVAAAVGEAMEECLGTCRAI